MKIGRVTLSDRASAGVYEDRSGPEIERVFSEEAVFRHPFIAGSKKLFQVFG